MSRLDFARTDDSSQAPESASKQRRSISAKIHTVGCSGLRTISVRGFRLSSGEGADVAGFDLGPSPEEHLLAALGSSITQSLVRVAAAHDLSVDRIDVSLDAQLVSEERDGSCETSIESVRGTISLTSEDPAGHFDGVADEALARSPLVASVRFPVTLSLDAEPVDRAAQYSDWQI